MKKYLIAFLALITAFTTPIYAECSTVFTVEPSVNNGVVSVFLRYENNKLIHSGEIDIVYDSDKLRLIKVVEGDSLSESFSVINDRLREDALRVVWATAHVLPESGCVLEIDFEMLSANFKESDIYAQNFEFGDSNGRIVKNVVVKSYADESGLTTGSESVIIKPETDSAYKDELSQQETAHVFIDVKKDDWFSDSVNYVSQNNLMSGVKEDTFDPYGKLTRAMMVVVLNRLEGSPTGEDAGFIDLEQGSWYENAVNWAAGKRIVNGVGNDKFEPNTNITREQIATILYKHAQTKDMVMAGATAILTPDSHQISDWAREAMGWAVGMQLIQGDEEGLLLPKSEATRAEFATILKRYINMTNK